MQCSFFFSFHFGYNVFTIEYNWDIVDTSLTECLHKHVSHSLESQRTIACVH